MFVQDPPEVLESGEETYFPALHIGLAKATSVVSFHFVCLVLMMTFHSGGNNKLIFYKSQATILSSTFIGQSLQVCHLDLLSIWIFACVSPLGTECSSQDLFLEGQNPKEEARFHIGCPLFFLQVHLCLVFSFFSFSACLCVRVGGCTDCYIHSVFGIFLSQPTTIYQVTFCFKLVHELLLILQTATKYFLCSLCSLSGLTSKQGNNRLMILFPWIVTLCLYMIVDLLWV